MARDPNKTDQPPIKTSRPSEDGIEIEVRLYPDDHGSLDIVDPDSEADQRMRLLGHDLELMGEALIEAAEQRKQILRKPNVAGGGDTDHRD